MELRFDFSPVQKFGNSLRAAGKQLPLVITRAVNHTGDKARTAMRRVLVKQTGLKYRTIVRAVKSTRSFNGSAYVIRSAGGDIRLKFFSPRETSKGVTAAPWSNRRLYPATFIRAGWWPNRREKIAGGQVLSRVGASKYPLKVVRSGLFIPNEMVSGASEAAFNSTVERELAPRIGHELYRVLG